MNGIMARELARALGGEVTAGPSSRKWAVGFDRPDGKYVLLDEDAGAVYHDRHACHVGYMTLGDDPKGLVDAREWWEWGTNERWARDLAHLIGGFAHHSGGNIWVVLLDRLDGKFVLIGDEGGAVYDNFESYDCGDDESMPGVEWCNWEASMTPKPKKERTMKVQLDYDEEITLVLPGGREIVVSIFDPQEENSFPELLITLPNPMAVNVSSPNTAAGVLVGSRIDIPIED